MDFYVTVTSSSSNDSSRLSARLPIQKHVTDYEVAALDVIMPSKWINIDEHSMILSGPSVRGKHVIVPAGFYETPTLYCEAIDRVLLDAGCTEFTFEVDAHCEWVSIRVEASGWSLRLTQAMAETLGLPGTIVASDMDGNRAMQTTKAFALVLANFVNASTYNSGVEQIMCTVPLDGKMVRQHTPQYKRMCVDYLDTISLAIVDADGRAVEFLSGTCCVCMHFRKSY